MKKVLAIVFTLLAISCSAFAGQDQHGKIVNGDQTFNDNVYMKNLTVTGTLGVNTYTVIYASGISCTAPVGATITYGVTAGSITTPIGNITALTTVTGTATDLETTTFNASGAVATGALTVTGAMSATTGITSSNGKFGTVDFQANTHYSLIVSTIMPSLADFALTPADGKAGSFIIIAGTYTATGSFTTAAAVTLGLSSVDTSTSQGTNGINVYDGGTIAHVENHSGSSKVVTIRYDYVQ